MRTVKIEALCVDDHSTKILTTVDLDSIGFEINIGDYIKINDGVNDGAYKIKSITNTAVAPVDMENRLDRVIRIMEENDGRHCSKAT